MNGSAKLLVWIEIVVEIQMKARQNELKKLVTESKAPFQGQHGSANSIPLMTYTAINTLSQSGPERTVSFNLFCQSAKFASNEAQTHL